MTLRPDQNSQQSQDNSEPETAQLAREQAEKFVERRKHPRFTVQVPATVRVIVEEQTFSPYQFDGTCQNLSRSGALLIIADMPRATYLTLIQRPRYVRFTCRLPGQEENITLFGKLVWYDWQGGTPKPTCKLAIAFEPMKEETVGRLDRFLASASSDKNEKESA